MIEIKTKTGLKMLWLQSSQVPKKESYSAHNINAKPSLSSLPRGVSSGGLFACSSCPHTNSPIMQKIYFNNENCTLFSDNDFTFLRSHSDLKSSLLFTLHEMGTMIPHKSSIMSLYHYYISTWWMWTKKDNKYWFKLSSNRSRHNL